MNPDILLLALCCYRWWKHVLHANSKRKSFQRRKSHYQKENYASVYKSPWYLSGEIWKLTSITSTKKTVTKRVWQQLNLIKWLGQQCLTFVKRKTFCSEAWQCKNTHCKRKQWRNKIVKFRRFFYILWARIHFPFFRALELFISCRIFSNKEVGDSHSPIFREKRRYL